MKICPIYGFAVMFLTLKYYVPEYPIPLSLSECRGIDCAWWDDTFKCCCLKIRKGK